MTAKAKAKDLVNQKYYQPLTLHLNVNNNSKQMWAYAQRCAHIVADEILEWERLNFETDTNATKYWNEVKAQIDLC
jgi:hypothetical protein